MGPSVPVNKIPPGPSLSLTGKSLIDSLKKP